MSDATCQICDGRFAFRWTDQHGVGACVSCGAPYTIYHYENDKRVDKQPSLLIRPEFVEITRKYWIDKRRNVAPGCFNFPGSSYEVATKEDFDAYSEWVETTWPKDEQTNHSNKD